MLISPAAVAEYPDACRALFADLPASVRDPRSARALELLTSGELSASGLLVARDGAQMSGAALYELHPGNAAIAWPPGANDPAVAERLANAVVERLRAAGVKQAQVLLSAAERDRARPLEAAGFRHVTQLAFLARAVAGQAPPDEPTRLTLTPVAGPEPRFARALLATYEGTLDCPELNGARTGDEILAGYGAKEERPDWFLASADGGPVGVVMFAPGPQPDMLDLSYVGLVPAARRKGYGRELVRFAVRHALLSAADWLVLSVDVRNGPARQLYRAHAFRECGLQDVFLWRPGR
jgi:ribosomal protein S18 acetylase RimI-like enzyme